MGGNLNLQIVHMNIVSTLSQLETLTCATESHLRVWLWVNSVCTQICPEVKGQDTAESKFQLLPIS